MCRHKRMVPGPSMVLMKQDIGVTARFGRTFELLALLCRGRSQLRRRQDGADFEPFEPFAETIKRLDWRGETAMAVIDLAKRRVQGARGQRHLTIDGTCQADKSRFGIDLVPAICLL